MAKITFDKNFADLKKLILKTDAKKLEGQFAFQFSIEGNGEGIFYFELKDGALFVEPYTYDNRTATFKATADTFKALLTGKVSAADAIANGDLKVEGNVPACADIFNTYMKKAPAKKETKPAAKAPAKKETNAAAKPAAKKAAPKAAAKPAAKKTAPKAAAKPAAKKEAPKADVKAEVKEAPKAEVKAAPKAEVKTEVKAEAKPAVKAEKPAAKTATKATAKKAKKTK